MADLSSDTRYAIGIKYPMDVELTELIPKDQNGEALVNDKYFLDYLGVSFVDAGAFHVQLKDKRYDRSVDYPIRSDFGRKLGDRKSDLEEEVLIESGTRQVTARGRTQDIEVHLINEGNIDSRIPTVSQHVTVVPK